MLPEVNHLRGKVTVTLIKTVFKHYFSKNYPRDWNLLFHIQFAILRQLQVSMIDWTIEELQAVPMSFLPPPKKGLIVSVFFEPSENDKTSIESEMRRIIEKLGPGVEKLQIRATSIRGEWQFPTAKKMKKSSTLRIKEHEVVLKSIPDSPVILFLHGGGYVAGSPAMEREATFRLAQQCGGKVFALDYRLAPQEPFPAALIDAVVAYKYLVDPPVDALHRAINPNKILIAGDSAGGGLAIALMAYLANAKPALPLPAGVLALSPLLDVAGSFPSTRIDKGLDWLLCAWDKPITPKPSKAWPLPHPRFSFYTDLPLHPLASPVLLASELPECSPLFIAVGNNEYLRDESMYFAANHAKRGGVIYLQDYQSMPHVFLMETVEFIKKITTGQILDTRMTLFTGKGKIKGNLDLKEYPIYYSKEELTTRMENAMAEKQAIYK